MSKIITHDQETRQDHKQSAMERVNKALSAKPEVVVSEVREVEVPSNFWSLSDPQLYGILKYQQLTPEETTDVIEQLRGRNSDQRFKLVLQAPTVELTVQNEESLSLEIPVVSVTLPEGFKGYKIKDQYLYLTKELALTPDKANDIVDILLGRSPLNKNVDYQIEFSEGVKEL